MVVSAAFVFWADAVAAIVESKRMMKRFFMIVVFKMSQKWGFPGTPHKLLPAGTMSSLPKSFCH
jgi:hypothetical protein